MLIIIILIIIMIGGVVLFFTLNSNIKFEEGKIINCGEIPKDFDVRDNSYIDNNPKVKENLICISENFRDCKNSKIVYLGDQVDNIFSINKEGSNCIINYESGNRGEECVYTIDQTKMLHEVSVEHNQPEATGISIALAMGFDINFGFKPGEINELEITNKYTLEKEKINCKYYMIGIEENCNSLTCSDMKKVCGEWDNGCGVNINCGTCDDGKNCIKGEVCESNSIAEKNDNQDIGTGNTVIAWGVEVEEGVAVYNQYNPDACLYSIYYSCDYFENGCNSGEILDTCYNQCLRTGGLDNNKRGAGTLTNNVIQCSCYQC